MAKVTIVQVVYNNRKWISAVFDAIFKQTFKDFNVVAVIAGNEDGSKEYLAEHYPSVEIIDPGYNIGFAKGHNLVFSAKGGSASGGRNSEFFQLVNPDLIMETNYLEEMVKAFNDPKVGAATGKLYKIIAPEKTAFSGEGRLLDTTGVTISKSGRARDRGQHEVDNHQYDNLKEVDGVSGAGGMYRASALQDVKVRRIIRQSAEENQIDRTNTTSDSSDKSDFPASEYFDEDFHSYWEDVDLSWRMKNAGWKNVFVPKAVGYHGRAAGSSRGGYLHFIDFIKHHRALPLKIRQLNYKNHIFMYIKNSPYFYPQFFVREFFMLIYILLFEISTLKVLPEMARSIRKMFKKRSLIKKGSRTP